MYGKELLYKGYLPTEIPQKCGYSDYSSFYTAFKAQYNVTPKEYYQLYSQKKQTGKRLIKVYSEVNYWNKRINYRVFLIITD